MLVHAHTTKVVYIVALVDRGNSRATMKLNICEGEVNFRTHNLRLGRRCCLGIDSDFGLVAGFNLGSRCKFGPRTWIWKRYHAAVCW